MKSVALKVVFMFQNYRAYSFCGTIEYMAPELVKGGQTGHDFVSIMLGAHLPTNADETV